MTLPDPPVRADGRCAQCGGARKPPARRQAGIPADTYDDPFCSTKCCRAWHGNPLPPVDHGGGRRKALA